MLGAEKMNIQFNSKFDVKDQTVAWQAKSSRDGKRLRQSEPTRKWIDVKMFSRKFWTLVLRAMKSLHVKLKQLRKRRSLNSK